MHPVARVRYLLAGAILACQASDARDARTRPRIETYDVSGESAQELRRELNRLGPLSHGERYDARTDWHVKWRFTLERSPAGCRVAGPRVELTVAMQLPRWRQPAGAARELVERWEAYLEALREHEDGHADVGQSAADEILAALQALPEAGNCAEAEQQANALSHEIVRRHNGRDLSYDEETRHGATQGARFP